MGSTGILIESPSREGTPWKNLPRRLPRVLIPYVGASWGVVQFTDWLVNHYLLSGLLVDLCVFITILMLPTAILLAYYRGEPGATPWTRAEKIGVPLNLATAAVVLSLLFHGKELG